MKVGKPKLSLDPKSLLAIVRGFFAYAGMSANALFSFTFYLLSFGKLTAFNYKYITPFFCRIILMLIGARVDFPKISDYPKKQVLYIFNHNSYLDIFIIPSMRIPKCKYIISKVTSNVIPLHLSNISNGALFIPRQKFGQEREEFFKETAQRLKNENFSIFTSPEGVHYFDHTINKFNKGVFHMAMEGKVDLCPIFFNMKKECNPFESFFYKAGRHKLEVLPLISTNDWTKENLDQKIKDVRQVFVDRFNEVHGESIS
ncbi:MAG: 1-acyl-sn-glycerol-3-phosphate acyltransferase [Thermoproteota archaeon]|jgi:1-acyl-sn-glycerol-3-phosphate acyltransferase